ESTILPANSPVPEVEPHKVRTLAPLTLAVRSLVNFKRPLPDCLIQALPAAAPARLTTRLVVSPLPVYSSRPSVVPLPKSIVPLATVVGAPSALATPRSLIELATTVP